MIRIRFKEKRCFQIFHGNLSRLKLHLKFGFQVFAGLLISCFVLPLALGSRQVIAQSALVSSSPGPSPPLLAAITQCDLPERSSFSLAQAQRLYESGCYPAAAQMLEMIGLQGDRLTQAITASNRSLAYQKLGQWEKAQIAIEQAFVQLNQLRVEQGWSEEQKVIQVQLFDMQGQLQLSTGQATLAAQSWKKAAQLYQNLGQVEQMALTQIKRSQALQALGLFQQVRTVLLDVEQSLRARPDSRTKAIALRQLADALWRTGNQQVELNGAAVEKKLTVSDLFEQSQAIGERLGQTEIQAATALSRGNFHRYRFLDEISRSKVDSSVAYQAIQEALTAYEEAATRYEVSGEPETVAIQARLNQFSLLIDHDFQNWVNGPKKLAKRKNQKLQFQVSPPLLRTQYQTMLEQFNQISPGRSRLEALIHLVESLNRLKAAQASAEQPSANLLQQLGIEETDIWALLQQAEVQAQASGDARALSSILGQEGYLSELEGKTKTAIQLTQQALSQAQSVNATEISYRWQRQLGRLFNQQGDRVGAIAAYTQAFEILQALRTDLISVNAEQRFHFRDNIEPVYRELVALLLPPPDSRQSGAVQVSQAELNLVRRIMDSLQIAELENFFQAACVDTKTALGEVLQPGDAGIYPILLEDRLEIVLQLPSEGEIPYTLRRFSAPISQDSVQTLVGQVQSLLDSSSIGAIGRLRIVSKKLYEQLFEAIEVGDVERFNSPKTLAEVLKLEMPQDIDKTLVFVLDEPLRSIPLGVLYDGDQYLLEQYAIALNLGIEVRESKGLPTNAELNILAAGVENPPPPFQRQRLRFVPQELKAIAKSGASVKVLQDNDFTEITFNEELNDSNFQVVHLATHGTFSSNREDTFILAKDRKIPLEQLSQLFRKTQAIQNPVELIIFSACRTATGDDRAVLGLAGATVQSGARSAIATLWSVDDAASVEFARSFYRYLEQPHMSRAVALQKAQLELKASRNNKHRFWAPYVLVGSWR